MNIDEFEDNDLSSDDSDFNPENNQDSVSDISGAEEGEPEKSDEENGTKNSKKSKKNSKRRRPKLSKEIFEEVKELDPEEEKRKADAIWEDFLNGTETPSEPVKSSTSIRASSSTSSAVKTETVTSFKPNIPAKTPAVAELFEFAGETVKIPTKVVEQEVPSTTNVKLPTPGVKRVSGGGLSSVLSQLTKKNKLSVLEKTKLDWDGFKDGEGINEELQTHNRGRDGFLERKDFLQRTDVRQFEIEKSMRLTRRK